jgi:hypothetical protein
LFYLSLRNLFYELSIKAPSVMKTKLFHSALFIFTFNLLPLTFNLAECQVPQGFNYQAIARDVVGDPIVNTSLPVKICIQSDSLGGTIFWEELHSAITTNAYGLFSLYVGQGTRQVASTVPTFNTINWAVTPKFINTKIWYGGEWKDMGSSRFWSVPYSMVSGSINETLNKLYVSGETEDMEEALFQVKNKDGQIIFAVYNEGVRVYVADGDSKGKKGGFAIGGFGATKADVPGQEYFVVSSDSIRAYIYDDPFVKTAKGGFAIGGFGMSKGGDEYLRINRDSTRVYINDLPGKGKKGGFAIGGFGSSKDLNYNFLQVDENRLKGGKVDYLNITSLNTFIGEEAGISTEPNVDYGVYNSFIGYQSGLGNISGRGNVFLGYQSGLNNKEGEYNVFIGNQSGHTNTGEGSFIGDYNVFIGYLSGYFNTDGQSNVFVGKQAGWKNSTGNYNTYLGQNAGIQSLGGSFNTYLGSQAASGKTGGSNNTIIGSSAGSGNADGSNNIFIGNQAGSAETGSDLLYIENTNSTTPLIGGDFATAKVAIRGIPDPASADFQVNGSTRIGTNGTTVNTIIRAEVVGDLDPLSVNESGLLLLDVPNAYANATVFVSPQLALDDGLVISYARVSVQGTVEVGFRNTHSSATIDLPNMNWYITVIQ